MPGIPSGENHSCASQQCGRNRIPAQRQLAVQALDGRLQFGALNAKLQVAESQTQELIVGQPFPGNAARAAAALSGSQARPTLNLFGLRLMVAFRHG